MNKNVIENKKEGITGREPLRELLSEAIIDMFSA